MRRVWFALPGAALALAGCSGDTVGPSGGLRPDLVLGDMTPAQTDQLCEVNLSRTLEDPTYVSSLCRIVGVYNAASLGDAGRPDEELRRTCELSEDECRTTVDDALADGDCGPLSSACRVTLAEYEACSADYLEAIIQFAQTLPTCFTVSGSDEIDVVMVEELQPASCAVVEEKCPEVLG